jgi:PPOX class probable F420-dependent enzyme
MSTQLPEGAHHLLDAANVGHLATLMEDGSPQVTPIWVDRDGDHVVVNTAKGRAKYRNIERDPRVAISVADADNAYTYVQVRGRAELIDDGAREHIDKLASKYLGVDSYPYAKPGEQRVIVRITPESVQYAAPRG